MLQALSKQEQTNLETHKAMRRFSAHIAPYGGRCCYHSHAINGADILLTFRDGGSLRVGCFATADLLLSLVPATGCCICMFPAATAVYTPACSSD